MNWNNLKLASFLNAVGVLAYVFIVASIMSSLEGIFDNQNEIWAGTTILLLFVLSASVVGLLVLGRPVYLYLEGKKSDALKLLFYTLGWLAVLIVAMITAIASLQPSLY